MISQREGSLNRHSFVPENGKCPLPATLFKCLSECRVLGPTFHQWNSDLWGWAPEICLWTSSLRGFSLPGVWDPPVHWDYIKCEQHYCLTALPPCPSSWSNYGNIPSSRNPRPERWWLFEGMMEPKSELWSPCQQDHSEEHLTLDPPLSLVTIKLHHLLWSIPNCSHRREPPTDISFPRRRCVWGAGRCCEYICHHINQVISTTYMIPVASWLWFIWFPGMSAYQMIHFEPQPHWMWYSNWTPLRILTPE